MSSKLGALTISEFSTISQYFDSDNFRHKASLGEYTDDDKNKWKQVCEFVAQLFSHVCLTGADQQVVGATNGALNMTSLRLTQNKNITDRQLNQVNGGLKKIIPIVTQMQDILSPSKARHMHTQSLGALTTRHTQPVNTHSKSEADLKYLNASASSLANLSLTKALQGIESAFAPPLATNASVSLQRTNQGINATSLNNASDTGSAPAAPSSSISLKSARLSPNTTLSNNTSDTANTPALPSSSIPLKSARLSTSTTLSNSASGILSMPPSPRPSASLKRESQGWNAALQSSASNFVSMPPSPRPSASLKRESQGWNAALQSSMPPSPRPSASLNRGSQSLSTISSASDSESMRISTSSTSSLNRDSQSLDTVSESNASDSASMLTSPSSIASWSIGSRSLDTISRSSESDFANMPVSPSSEAAWQPANTIETAGDSIQAFIDQDATIPHPSLTGLGIAAAIDLMMEEHFKPGKEIAEKILAGYRDATRSVAKSIKPREEFVDYFNNNRKWYASLKDMLLVGSAELSAIPVACSLEDAEDGLITTWNSILEPKPPGLYSVHFDLENNLMLSIFDTTEGVRQWQFYFSRTMTVCLCNAAEVVDIQDDFQGCKNRLEITNYKNVELKFM